MDIAWLSQPQEHDYPAARDYLSLVYEPAEAMLLEAQLRAELTSEFKAKDILRASGLPLLPATNKHVERNRHKVLRDHPLSPLLLVRDKSKVVVADGYHRLCAVYHLDEDAIVVVKIV